jgi:hypothetical protein
MNDKYFGVFLLVLFVMMGCAGKGDYEDAKRTESKPVVRQCF